MKLLFNLELLSNLCNKVVCVYKIEQQDFIKKNIDIRDATEQILEILFTEKLEKNQEFFIFNEEILIDNLFKMFIFIICESEDILHINQSFSEFKWIQFADKYEISPKFLKNQITKIIKTHFHFYFKYNCKLQNLKDFYLISKVNVFDYEFSNYLYFALFNKDIRLVRFIQQGNMTFMKLEIIFEIGLLKIKECENINSIKTIPKFEQNQIFNKSHLSQVKWRQDKIDEIFLTDERTKLKTNIQKFKWDVILNYPISLPFKSKFYYPYIIVTLLELINNFNNKCFLINSNNNLHSSISLENILVDQSDNNFFNKRISYINEEDNLKIYEKITMINEKMKNTRLFESEKHNYNRVTKNFPFSFYLNYFLSNFDKKIINDPLFSSYYLSLHKHSNLFVAGSGLSDSPNQNSSRIELYDENFKNYYELAVLEFFAFILYFCKNKTEEEEELESVEKMSENKRYESLYNNFKGLNPDHNNNLNLNNCSFLSQNSSQKKSLLKPFNKEEILYQEDCETDYGNKKFTKKDIKNREDYIKKVICTANKVLFEQVEGEIIHGNFMEKEKKVVFCIPNDRDSIINKLPNL